MVDGRAKGRPGLAQPSLAFRDIFRGAFLREDLSRDAHFPNLRYVRSDGQIRLGHAVHARVAWIVEQQVVPRVEAGDALAHVRYDGVEHRVRGFEFVRFAGQIKLGGLGFPELEKQGAGQRDDRRRDRRVLDGERCRARAPLCQNGSFRRADVDDERRVDDRFQRHQFRRSRDLAACSKGSAAGRGELEPLAVAHDLVRNRAFARIRRQKAAIGPKQAGRGPSVVAEHVIQLDKVFGRDADHNHAQRRSIGGVQPPREKNGLRAVRKVRLAQANGQRVVGLPLHDFERFETRDILFHDGKRPRVDDLLSVDVGYRDHVGVGKAEKTPRQIVMRRLVAEFASQIVFRLNPKFPRLVDHPAQQEVDRVNGLGHLASEDFRELPIVGVGVGDRLVAHARGDEPNPGRGNQHKRHSNRRRPQV